MSMIRCDLCGNVFDTDFDPSCFDVETDSGTTVTACERCREDEKLAEFAEEYEA